MVSQIFEEQKDEAGNGLIGFTVQYAWDRVENHIRNYSPATRISTLEEIQAKHRCYVHAFAQPCQPEDKQIKTQNKSR